MTLDPQVQHVLDLVKEAGYPEFHQLSPAEARALFDKTVPILDAPFEAVGRCEDINIPGPAGPIPARIYGPRTAAAATPLPMLAFYHGGGFVIGGLDSYDRLCRVLANRAGCLLVSVDYRLAPEHKFPAAPEDAYAAAAWLAANAQALGGDPARLAVGGDSAGGNLAAVTAILARDRGGPKLAFQFLVYPCTAETPESASHHAFAEGYLLSRRNILWFQDHYRGGPEDRHDPRYAPLLADLSGLPPALVIVAGYDPLRDEGLAYAEKLKQAGTPVTVSNYEGMVHGFFSLSGAIDGGKRAIDESAQALKAAFGIS